MDVVFSTSGTIDVVLRLRGTASPVWTNGFGMRNVNVELVNLDTQLVVFELWSDSAWRLSFDTAIWERSPELIQLAPATYRLRISADGQEFVREAGSIRAAVDLEVYLQLPESAPCRADFNGDDFLDFFDYDDFVGCFEGDCADSLTADFNDDGFVDFFDYDAFVEAFEVGC